MHSQKRQTPQLPDITFRRRQLFQLRNLVSVIIRPAPHLLLELNLILLNQIPKVIIRRHNLRMQRSIVAEIWSTGRRTAA